MTILLSLMFWTILLRLFLVRLGYARFEATMWLELEEFIIQLSSSILSLIIFIALYFLLVLLFGI